MSKHNGLGTILIGGQERPYHVNSTRQTEKFTETLGVELDEYWSMVGKLSDGKALSSAKIAIVFLWSALYAGAIKVNRKCDFTYDDVLDWFEEAETEAETTELMKPMMLFVEMLTETKKKLDEHAKLNKA